MSAAMTEPCCDCRGTGGEDPDCKTCRGYRYVRLPALYARGWRKNELEDVDESDGFARCPDCGGGYCELCGGDGERPVGHRQAERERILLTALDGYNAWWPRISIDPFGRLVRDEDAPLSIEAREDLHREGRLFCGTRLWPAGRREVMALFDDGTQRFLAEEGP